MIGPVVPPGGEDRIPNWFGDILGDHTRPPVDGEGEWTPPATVGGRWARTNRSTGVYETWAGPEDDARLLAESMQRARAALQTAGEDELREALAEAVAEALDDAYDYSSYRWPQQQDCPRIANALLPVVLADRERHARARAAEELRAAAASALNGSGGRPLGWLLARADALSAHEVES